MSSASKHVEASRSMEQTARQMMDNARKNRQTAQSLLDGSKKEVKAAEKFLKGARGRWSAEAEAMGVKVEYPSSVHDNDNEAGQLSGKKRERENEDAELKQEEGLGGIDSILANNWESEFELLKVFHAKEGHCNVPTRNKALGRWVGYQRTSYKDFNSNKKTKMTPDRISRLESIGFKWSAKMGAEEAWNIQYDQLLLFHESSGHYNVPSTYPDQSLANWVRQQRKLYRKNKLPKERSKRLEELGFVFNVRVGRVSRDGGGRVVKVPNLDDIANDDADDDDNGDDEDAHDAEQEEEGLEGIDSILAKLAARPSSAKKGGGRNTRSNARRLSSEQIIEVIEEECRKPKAQCQGGMKKESNEENAKSDGDDVANDDDEGNQSPDNNELSNIEAEINKIQKKAESSKENYEGNRQSADDIKPSSNNNDAEINQENNEENTTQSNKEDNDDDHEVNKKSDKPSNIVDV